MDHGNTDHPAQQVLGDFIDQDLLMHEAALGPRTKLPWYRAAFQADYLDIYHHRDLDEAARAVRFLSEALALDPTQRLLDLCCGPGRHLAFLRNYVKEAAGLDLSRALLRRAQENCGMRNAECGIGEMRNAECGTRNEDRNPQLIQADMRRLPLAGGSFDRVVNLFTSFGYFEAEADNQAVLGEIARVLRPGGLLALDHINREAMLAHLRPRTERALPDGRLLTEKRRFDEVARRVVKDVAAAEPGGQVKAWQESVRVYEPAELEAMLEAAGLAPRARHGDYNGEAWRPDSPRLLLIAEKKTAIKT